jgi:hypothetical protein
MSSHLKSALKSPALAEPPTDAEIARWLAASPALPADVTEEFARRGSPFSSSRTQIDSAPAENEVFAAMNRANPDDKLSPKTHAELARLRREKLRE